MRWRILGAGVAAILVMQAADPAGKAVKSVLARKNYWAFQPVKRPDVPPVASPWVRNPIDAFLFDAMRQKKLTPSPSLDRARLLRRVTLDLTGLPPTPGELDLFLRDSAPDAYERAVDRLMASPHYGERWASKWLDVVRYADTNGYEMDAERPNAWRYRDYIVNAFNHDKPYDRMIREQIAGDELFPGNQEALIATGFHRVGPIHLVSGNQDEEANRQEVLTEMTSAIGSVFLGMTVGCARCHNHKFDPILQADYYRLQAVFAATEFKDVDIATPEEKERYEAAKRDWEARLKPLKDEIAAIEKPYRERLTEAKRAQLDPALRAALDIPKEQRNEEQKRLAKDADGQIKLRWDEVLDALPEKDRTYRASLRGRMHEIERYEPRPPPAAFASVNTGKAAPAIFILKVGDPKHKMGEVQPGVPLVIEDGRKIPPADTGRRAALAEWLASPEHPLTARVMVNRIWQFRMGTGLVRTPNDFGVLGDKPVQPQLLDWLASEFVARGWSVKTLDRLIVTSSAYRQTTVPDPAKTAIDPENRHYWRTNHRRLEGEAIRDAVLAVSGDLVTRLGGPPVKVPLQPEVYDLLFTEGEPDGLWPVDPDPSQLHRRSLYLLNKRTVRLPMMAAFDQPDAMTSCPVRPVSTHSLQALSLFNSDFMHEQAGRFASRLQRECGSDEGCVVRRAYHVALSRPPSAPETSMAREFLHTGGLLPDFCLALVNRHDFVYIP